MSGSASTSTFDPSTFDFESTTTYMDNGYDYCQPIPSSSHGSINPNMLNDSGSNMDLNTLNSLNHDFAAYSSIFDLSPRPFTPSEPAMSEHMGSLSPPPMFSYNLDTSSELIDSFMPAPMMAAPQPQALPSARGRGSRSPAYGAHTTAPRATGRFNPMSIPASRATGRAQTAVNRRKAAAKRQSDDFDSDEEDEEYHPVVVAEDPNAPVLSPAQRREAVRKQRIESEQRRRDELREGYAKLKGALPHTNMKSSKVSLLERSTNRLIELEALNKVLEQKLADMSNEMRHAQRTNETIMLTRATMQQQQQLQHQHHHRSAML